MVPRVFRLLATLSIFTAAVSSVWSTAYGAALKEAQVTQAIHEVNLRPSGGASRRAVANENVPEGTAVGTGADSRAELMFSDKTLARLGANTLLRFGKESGGFEVRDGVVLLQTPKSMSASRINGNGIAVDFSGATLVFENRAPTYKLLVLQGTARLYRPRHLGDSVLVRAGQMAFGAVDGAVSNPVDFDVERFVKTCRLITGFSPLGSDTLLAKETQKQQRAKSKKVLIDTNLVINGGGTLVSIVDPAQGEGINRAETTAPAPDSAASPAPTSLHLPPPLDRPTNLTR